MIHNVERTKVRWSGLQAALMACLSLAVVGDAGAQTRAPAGRPPDPKGEAAPASRRLAAESGEAVGSDQQVVGVAEVIEVAGTVEWAKAGADVLEEKGWHEVKVGDRLAPGTQLRTGLRSHLNLQFGDTTLVSVRSATHASIDEFYRSAKAETVRVGLAYGTVRGGSSEGEVRSDVVVDSPAATLAKRGTDGWQMRVEPATGRFRISLARHGLVEAIRKERSAGRNSRNIRPGEYATEANIANLWVRQDIFDRNVRFYEADAVSTSEADFSTAHTRGFTVVATGAGSEVAGRQDATFVLDQIAETFGDTAAGLAIVQRLPFGRPEGNFGTGATFKVLLPEREGAARNVSGSVRGRAVRR